MVDEAPNFARLALVAGGGDASLAWGGDEVALIAIVHAIDARADLDGVFWWGGHVAHGLLLPPVAASIMHNI